MKLAFILGRKYSLSIAEIFEVLATEKISFKVNSVAVRWLIIEIKSTLDSLKLSEKLQNRLGGSIKIAEIVEETNVDKLPDLPLSLFEKLIPTNKRKINIGISIYGDTRPLPRGFQKSLGMSLKNFYEERGHKANFVYSGDLDISSVTFTKKLKDKGADINFFASGKGKIFIGKTLTVQDFEAYSRRDYGRPMVSKKSGALPPKLAQIMINLLNSTTDKHIYDPFCGSGTTLAAAKALGLRYMGYEIDSDTARKAMRRLQ